ncbi:MAG: DMT family transporter [Proteobacteria bacterium]|nr:DMT family transporter [Pseudomonadota bacterium]
MTAAEATIAATRRWKGVMLMLGAEFCWSTGGILVRNVTDTPPMQTVFWRAAMMTIFLCAVLAVQYRGRSVAAIRAVGRAGILAGAFLAVPFVFFVLAVNLTTVANTQVIIAVAPFFTALWGRLLLAEAVPTRTWLAMTVALAGIGLMFADSLADGDMIGNIVALAIPIALSSSVLVLRRAGPKVDMLPMVFIAGLIAATVSLPFALPLVASAHDLGVIAVMACLQVGLGSILMTLAVPYLSAAEVGLLLLVESILGPAWVWIFLGERPSDLALVGGLVVLGSLVANEAARSRVAT